jgi:hypothetical protein
VSDRTIPDIFWERKGIYSLLGVSLQTDKIVLHEEVANIINTRINCFKYIMCVICRSEEGTHKHWCNWQLVKYSYVVFR